MNQNIKSILLISLTLAIGFVAGFMTHGQLSQNRFQQMRSRMGKPNGYIEYMKRVMEVTEEQDVYVQPILELFAPIMKEHHHQFRREVKLMIDSLSTELSPYLEKEQLEKLKRRYDRSSHKRKMKKH